MRCVHINSGATGQASDSRSQFQNKKLAFARMVENKTFQDWLKIETAKITGKEERIKKEVDKMMDSRYLKIEGKNEKGLWIEIC